MALFDEEGLPNTTRINPIPEVRPYASARVNTEDHPVGTLLTHIGGMRWIPDCYFSQVLGEDEEVGAYQGRLRPINRQYKKIYGLEIKVQTPAPNSTSVDPQNQEFTVKGTARVYPGTVIPNPGDMIIGDTADGRKAIYQVADTVIPLTVFMRTAYEFEYVMVAWWSPQLEEDMSKGVVETYHFIRDNIDAGLQPLIAEEDWGTWKTLTEYEKRFPQVFTHRFISREFSTFILPAQPTSVYDPFHAAFCSILFRPNIGAFGGINLIPVEDGSNAMRLTVHSVLLKMDPFIFQDVLSVVPIIPSSSFLAEPYLGGVRFCGTRWVVYPPEDTRLLFSTEKPLSVKGLTLVNGVNASPKTRLKLSEAFSDPHLGSVVDSPSTALYYPTTHDAFYIFSEAFYAKDTEEMALIERLLWQTITQNMIPPKTLIALFKASEKWSLLDQFYLQPFLYAMIPAALRGV